MIDLHLHSNYSDGIDSPEELVDKSLSLGLKAIALTDHDTIEGIRKFLRYAEIKEIIAITGIEISIRHEPKREIEDVHIIGLNIDPESNELISTLNRQKEGRFKQKKDICNRLREEFGYNITFEEAKSIAGESSVGRPHIVEILTKNNPEKIKAFSRNELFKMISLGGKAYVDRDVELNLEESTELIKASGGIPILAHPGIYEISNPKKFIQMCVTAGIIGIEIEYTYSKNRPYHNTPRASWAQQYFPSYYNDLADKMNLIKSGGSDYHGVKKNIKIGDANVPDKYLEFLV